MILPPELAAADAAIRRALGIRGGRRKVKRKWYKLYCWYCRKPVISCACPISSMEDR